MNERMDLELNQSLFLPLYVSVPPSSNKQEVAQPVYKGEDRKSIRLSVAVPHIVPLGPPAHSPRNVQLGARRDAAPARDDEAPQRRQLRVELVDLPLDLQDLLRRLREGLAQHDRRRHLEDAQLQALENPAQGSVPVAEEEVAGVPEVRIELVERPDHIEYGRALRKLYHGPLLVKTGRGPAVPGPRVHGALLLSRRCRCCLLVFAHGLRC